MNPTSASAIKTQSNGSSKPVNSFQPKSVDPRPNIFESTQPLNRDLFNKPPIIRTDSQKSPQTNARLHKKPQPDPKNRILSRVGQKKVTTRQLEMNKKPIKKAQPNSLGLTLINEESNSEYSSAESGQVLDHSHDGYNSESQGSQYWKIGPGYEDEGESENDEDLDRTVVMTRKNVLYATEKTEDVEGSQEELHEEEDEARFHKILSKYPFEQIEFLYKKGKISEKDFKRILQKRIQLNQILKDERFQENTEKINTKIYQIFERFINLNRKLCKDITGTQLKYKELEKDYEDFVDKLRQQSEPFSPQKLSREMRLLQKQSEIDAKKQIELKVRNCLKELESKYSEHMERLVTEQKQTQNYSENLIFKEIKEFLKLTWSIYSGILSSLDSKKQTKKSIVAQLAHQIMIEKLKQKYQKQEIDLLHSILFSKIQDIQKFNIESLTNEAYMELMNKASTALPKRLKRLKMMLHKQITFVKMVSENGELNHGKTYRNAINLLKQNPSTNLSFYKYAEKTIVKTFRFYHKNVYGELMNQYLLLQSLHTLFQTRPQATILREKEKQNQNLNNFIDYLEKISFSLSKVSKVFEKKSQNHCFQNRGIEQFMDQKRKNLEKLKKQAENALNVQTTTDSYQKSLISKSKIASFDFRTNTDEMAGQPNTKIPQKTNWKDILIKNTLTSFASITSSSPKDKFDLFKTSQKQKTQEQQNLKMIFEQDNRKFACEMSQTFKENIEKSQEEETKKHFKKVYELISKNKINYEDQIYVEEEPYEPEYESIFYQILDSIQLTGTKNASKGPYNFDHFSISTENSRLSSYENKRQTTQTFWFKQNQSVEEIEAACQLFSREYHRNGQIRQTLKLNDHQFYFLMSPEYRKYFMNKKIKDNELASKLIDAVKKATNRKDDFLQSDTPIKYVVESDEYFRQRIDEYLQKMNQIDGYCDPNQPRLVYEIDQVSTCDSSEFESLQRRVRELQERTMSEYYLKKYGNLTDYEKEEVNDGSVHLFSY